MHVSAEVWMNTVFQIAIGGGLGAALRYGSIQGAVRVLGLGAPAGVFAVNVAGSFLMGLFAVWFLERVGEARFAPFVMTGILGGFTTFSAFSLDAILLWEQGRGGVAMVYVLGSVLGAIAALFVGMIIMRAVLS
nr:MULTISPECIES: CrcB family protein [Rhodobacterales]